MLLRKITAFLLISATLCGVALADTSGYSGASSSVRLTFDLPKDVSLTDFSEGSAFTGELGGGEYSFTGRPFLLNDSTYIPLRDLADAFGMYVEWAGADRQAILISGNKMLIVSAGANLKPGGSVLWSGSSTQYFDQTALIVSGRTYLPLRFVLETFGFTVEYDSAQRRITLSGEISQPSGYSDFIYGVQSVIVESIRSFDTAAEANLTGAGNVSFTARVTRGTDVNGTRNEIYRITDAEGECVLTHTVDGSSFYFDGGLAEPTNIDIYMQLTQLALSGIRAYESLSITGYEVIGNVSICRISSVGGKAIDLTIWVDAETKKLLYYSVIDNGDFTCPEITMEISY